MFFELARYAKLCGQNCFSNNHGSVEIDFVGKKLPSLKLTFSNLKMDGWNTSFLLGRPICRGYVSFREGNYYCRHLFFTSMSIGGRVLNFESDFLQPAVPGLKTVDFAPFGSSSNPEVELA